MTPTTYLDGNTRAFGYDAADRVLSSVNSALPSARNEAFSYDEEGNRTDSARLHDAADELTEDATYTYAYDVEGNLVSRTSKSDPTKVTTYAYDAMNRLVQVQTAAGDVVTFAYDALGRRVAKSLNGAITRFVLDGWNVRLELSGATGSSVLAANTHAGLDRLLVRDQGGTSLFLHADGLNSTTALTDSGGNVLERYRYAAFGKLEVLNPDGTPKTGNVPVQPFTFTGREWEPESGLFFYRNRFYSAQMGRFVNRDPIGEQGGVNLYSYVGSNPVNSVDPLGLWTTYIRLDFTFIVANLNIGIAFDGRGNVGVQMAPGYGFSAGASVTAGATFTAAPSIKDLEGTGTSAGAALNLPGFAPGLGAEVNYVWTGKPSDFGKLNSYDGVDVGLGFGVGPPTLQMFVSETATLFAIGPDYPKNPLSTTRLLCK